MKKILISLIAGALAALMLTSCSDTVDTETTASSTQSTVSTESSTTESSVSSSETTESTESTESTETSASETTESTESSSSSATESETTTDHNHVAVGAWERNATEHWHLCEDGEKTDVGEHTLDDEDVCTVCGSVFWFMIDEDEEGFYFVYVLDFDSHGELVRYTLYNGEGTALKEGVCDIVYDDDGNKVLEKVYENGALIQELFYEVNENGSYRAKEYYYEEFGLSIYYEYNEFEDPTLCRSYDETGEVILYAVWEYVTDEDGNYYMSKYTEYDYTAETIIIEEHNSHDEMTLY